MLLLGAPMLLLLLVMIVFVPAAVAIALHRPLHFTMRVSVGTGERTMLQWFVSTMPWATQIKLHMSEEYQNTSKFRAMM